MSHRMLGQRVQAMRLARQMDRAALSREAGLSPGTVKRIEEGEGNPQLEAVLRLAVVFAVSLDDLIDVIDYGVDADGKLAEMENPLRPRVSRLI